MPKGGGADAGEVRTETAFNGRSVPVTINDARKGGGGESEGRGGVDVQLVFCWALELEAMRTLASFPGVRYTYKTTKLEARVKLAKHLLLEAAQLPGCGSVKRWILAGHSMGARVAAAAAAQRQEIGADVIGCLLLSYPLHPPGNPDKLRDQLLLDLDVPTLIVRGSRDPFSQLEKFAATVKRMSCAHEVLDLEGGDHGLNVRGKTAAAVVAEVGAQVHAFFQPLRDASAEESVPHVAAGSDPQPAASPAAQSKSPARSRKGMGRRDASGVSGGSGQQQAAESPAKRRRQKQRQEDARGGGEGESAGGEAGSVQPMKKPPAPSEKAKKPARPSRSKKP